MPAVVGLQTGDSVTGKSQAFQSKNVLGAGGSTLVVTAYTVNDGNGGANYTTSTNTATGTISPALLSINAVSDSKTYDGTTSSSGVPAVVGLQTGDSVTGKSQAFQSKNVLGAGGSTLVVTAYTVNDGNGGANYTTSTNTATGTISPRSATWTTKSNSKTLGTLDPVPLTTGSGSNFIAADGVSASYSRVTGEAAGTYHITATLSATVASDLSNYSITNTGATFTILYSTGTCLGSPGHQVLQPINADESSVLKKGSTVPAKFRVCDIAGNSIGTAGVVTSFALTESSGP